MNGTIRSAESAGFAPARLAGAGREVPGPLARSPRQHRPPGTSQVPRSIVPIGLASVIISGCLYAGTELVLALLDRPALLAAPADVVRYVSQVNEIAPAVLLALGLVVASAGVALVVVTGRTGRRPRISLQPIAGAHRAGEAVAVEPGTREPGSAGRRPAPTLRTVATAPDRFTAAKAIADALAYDNRQATRAPTVVSTTTVPQPPPRERENTMSGSDKIENAAQDLGGKAKEAFGKATDDDSKVAEGKADQAGADLKKAGENVKDAFKK
jgi:uncharacterized protein YjbJ (UPF0337 family)